MRFILICISVICLVTLSNGQGLDVQIKNYRTKFYTGINNYFEVNTCSGDTVARRQIKAYRNHFEYDDTEKGYIIIRIPIEIKGNNQKSFYIDNNGIGSIDFEIDYRDSIYIQNFRSYPIPAVGRFMRYGSGSNNKLSIAEFKSAIGLIAQITELEIDGRCAIRGFELWRIPKQGERQMTTNIGGRFTKEAKSIINNTEGGDLYLFRNIQYKCPGDQDYKLLEDLTFIIKESHYQIDTTYYPNGYSIIRKIDKQTKDTIIHDQFTGEYKVISRERVVLRAGSIGGRDCGEPSKTGYWMERYRSGGYKSIGSYFCDAQIGTWTYYSESGAVSKIESYDFAYPSKRNMTNIFMSGYYNEYHENGNKKIEGQYEIFEKYFRTDTLYTIDYETYEEKLEVVKGDFWKPISVKTGRWILYDKLGKMVNMEMYFPVTNNDLRILKD